MNNYELIQHLEACNLLQPLLGGKLMHRNILEKRDIYQYYDKEIKTGKTRMDALSHTSEDFKISERQVYRIIEQMEMKYENGSAHLR